MIRRFAAALFTSSSSAELLLRVFLAEDFEMRPAEIGKPALPKLPATPGAAPCVVSRETGAKRRKPSATPPRRSARAGRCGAARPW